MDFFVYYEWFKAVHIVAVISWMAAMLYLPRLYAYHANLKLDSESYILLNTMERRLIFIIMNPAMILTYILGGILAYFYGIEALGIWFHVKLTAVIILSALHGYFIHCYKMFKFKRNQLTSRTFKIVNELVTILMIVAVVMVVVKPFE